ncbi:MAG: DUF4350 domain-containing protein [Actinomycetes bacterium]|nr:MAG: hypothetical protein DIU73_03780 [Actinomycetota bacterium]
MSAPSVEYTRAQAGPGLVARARRGRVAIVFALVFVLIVALLVLTRPDRNDTALSTNNPGPFGTKALAEVARDQGVDVREVDALGRARIADPAATTLVIADGGYLQGFQARSILDYPGDVVVFGDAWPLLSALGADLEDVWSDAEGPVDARCAHPDAQAAGTVTSTGMAVAGELPPGAEGCFSTAPGEWLMVALEDSGRRIVVVSDLSIPLNQSILDEGNAALALRLIGKHPTVVWYVGSMFDSSTLTWSVPGQGGGSSEAEMPQAAPDFLPPGTGSLVYGLALALIAVALWRARRFGPLVTEPLPVVIRASEATRGRARMYRAARAYGRAATALRASAATRLGKRLGVPRTSTQEALVAAVARASGRDGVEVSALLFGPPPESESAMMELAQALDQLEREVHRT